MNDVAIMSNNLFNNDYNRIEENERGNELNKSNILYCNDDCTRINNEYGGKEDREDVEGEM